MDPITHAFRLIYQRARRQGPDALTLLAGLCVVYVPRIHRALDNAGPAGLVTPPVPSQPARASGAPVPPSKPVAGIGRRRARPGKLVVDWRDAGGVRHTREFPDSKAGEQAAQELLVRVRRQAQTGRVVPDERLTFGDYFTAWMQATRHGLAENTIRSRETSFKRHLLPAFQRAPFVRIGRAAVRGLLAGMLERGYAPGTVHQVLLAAGSMFSFAVDSGDMESNPLVGLARRMRLSAQAEHITALSRDELGQFLAAAREGSEYPALALLAFSGIRVSEARGLQWADLTYAERTLRIERQMHDTGQVARLKSRFSVRTVDLPASLCTLYRDRASLARKGPWLLSPGWGAVVTPGEAHRRYEEVRGALKAALALAGLPGHFSPHSLRHSFARLHLEGGKELLWVSRQLGHSSIKITADRYGRFAELRGEGAADRLAASVEGQALRTKVRALSP